MCRNSKRGFGPEAFIKSPGPYTMWATVRIIDSRALFRVDIALYGWITL